MNQGPSFYAVIPANVRYDAELSSSAKLLYGEITALTQQEGYCWASNQYFAELYGVDIRTVKRWIKALEERQYIDVDTQKVGMNWDRRITLKNCVRRDTTNPSRGRSGLLREDQKVQKPIDPYLINTTKNNKSVADTKTTSVFVADADAPPRENADVVGSKITLKTPDGQLTISHDDLYRKATRSKKNLKVEELEYAWGVLRDYRGIVHDWWRFLEGTIDRYRSSKRGEHAMKKSPAKAKQSVQSTPVKEAPASTAPPVEQGRKKNAFDYLREFAAQKRAEALREATA